MIVTAKPTNPAHPPAPKRMHTGARPSAPKRASAQTSASERSAKAAAAPAAGLNSFPKSVRLLKHASFQHVYENGRKHFSTTMIFFFVLKPVEAGTCTVQIGITVGRALGGAVDRNRIKRRMRDIVRHNLGTLREALTARGLSIEVVINPKKAALTADIAALRAEVERGFGVIASANTQVKNASGEARTQ